MITPGDSVLDSSPRRYSHIYLTPGCVRYLFRILAKNVGNAFNGLTSISAGYRRSKQAYRHDGALAIGMTCPRTCQTSWFHTIQLSTITYGLPGTRTVFLHTVIPGTVWNERLLRDALSPTKLGLSDLPVFSFEERGLRGKETLDVEM